MKPLIWDVSPILFKLGSLEFRWYGMLFGLGFLIGYFIMHWMFEKEGKPADDVEWVLIYALIGTTLGARIGHCLFYDPAYYLSNPLEILKIWKGGLASHGAAIGIFAAFYIFSRRRNSPYLWIMDRMALVTALAGCFIRLGNLFNSEILGLPTQVSWAVIFKRVDMIPRHPVQLYEALCYLAIFFILLAVYRKRKGQTPHGLIVGLFLIMIFGVRFVLEYFKTRQENFVLGIPMNMGQLLSIPSVALGAWLVYLAQKAPPLPAQEPPKTEKPESGPKKSGRGNNKKKK